MKEENCLISKGKGRKTKQDGHILNKIMPLFCNNQVKNVSFSKTNAPRTISPRQIIKIPMKSDTATSSGRNAKEIRQKTHKNSKEVVSFKTEKLTDRHGNDQSRNHSLSNTCTSVHPSGLSQHRLAGWLSMLYFVFFIYIFF